jgi:hypothetical protein
MMVMLCKSKERNDMRTSLCTALAFLTAAAVWATNEVAKEQEAVEPTKVVAGQEPTQEPRISFDKAVELAKKEMKQRALDEKYYIRSMAYETHVEAPPRWMFVLSPKAIKAPKAEPGLLIEMDGSVTLIKGR